MKMFVRAGQSILAGTLVASAAMAAGEGGAPAAGWPANRDGLVFLWQSGDRMKTPALALDAEGKEIYAYAPVVRGYALYGRNYEMVLRNGSFLAKGVGTRIARSAAEAKAFSLELYVTPFAKGPAQPAVMAGFMNGIDAANFVLAQQGDALLLRLNTAGAGAPWLTLAKLPDAKPFHLVVACGGGTVTAYVNGKAGESLKTDADPGAWAAQELVFGDSLEEKHAWSGCLEGIAIYRRALTATDAAADAAAYAGLVGKRTPVARLRLRGKLLQRSESHTKIDPYFRSMALFEYKVEKVAEGAYDKPTIFVNHWTVMHKKLLPLASRALEQSYDLVLEPQETHPELEPELQADSLKWNYDMPVYYDVSDRP